MLPRDLSVKDIAGLLLQAREARLKGHTALALLGEQRAEKGLGRLLGPSLADDLLSAWEKNSAARDPFELACWASVRNLFAR